MNLRRGEVVDADLDPTIGSEIKKSRPCVVVQRNAANKSSPTVIVCPLTAADSSAGNLLNIYVAAGIAGLRKPSLVVCNQMRTIDKRRISATRGMLSAEIMARVDRGLRAILDLG